MTGRAYTGEVLIRIWLKSDENETKKQRKNDTCVKMLLMEKERDYRVCMENSCHGYQQASSQ